MTGEPAAFLVDTNVISRGPDHRPGSPVERWIRAYAPLLRISVITIAEARRGLVLAQQTIDRLRDPGARAREQAKLDAKTAWYRTLRSRFTDRIEPIDADIAESWADISVRFPSLRDGDKAILATALVRNLGIATRNVSDFQASGVMPVNPFDPDTWERAPSCSRACVRCQMDLRPPLQPNRRAHRPTVSTRSPDREAASRWLSPAHSTSARTEAIISGGYGRPLSVGLRSGAGGKSGA